MSYCPNCRGQRAMAANPYARTKPVTFRTAKSTLPPRVRPAMPGQGTKPSRTTTYYRPKPKPAPVPQTEPQTQPQTVPETVPQEIPVQTNPLYYSQDVNTTINPLLDQYNNFATDQERFNFLTQQGGSNGWRYAGQQLGLTPEQMAPMQAIANGQVGTKTFDYSANPQLAQGTNYSTTNYFQWNDQNQTMVPVEQSAIPQGAQINKLAPINNTYTASMAQQGTPIPSKPIAQTYRTGGSINYLSYFNY